MSKYISFIGCGNMGEAILSGILKKNLFKRSQIIVSDAYALRRAYIRKNYKVLTLSSNPEAVRKSGIVILAVKPQEIGGILYEVASLIKNKLIISIAAGITTDYIKKKTAAKRIIRVMPNGPALAGCGVSAISYKEGVGPSDIRMAERIFASAGKTIHIKEKYMDTVTAVSGSGPAYFFLLMEAMIGTAVALGIKEGIAGQLVKGTALGSVLLLDYAKTEPSLLRKRVTSKGGTTEAALKVFKKKRFEDIVAEAIKAAVKRAKELSR